ncbi:MAG: DNA ligase-associated DEXH box helicase, partial [Gemmatimonadales bacterium]|nr:DNA ligase-associated DEXH box helicase [Gemmatimonadales bacterium]
MRAVTLLRLTDCGLYCDAGQFYVDPWAPVDRAVITHAHGDHATWGCREYLTSAPGRGVLELRVGGSGRISALPYGETRLINGVTVSLHPAGHILGSAQVRIEHAGEV